MSKQSFVILSTTEGRVYLTHTATTGAGKADPDDFFGSGSEFSNHPDPNPDPALNKFCTNFFQIIVFFTKMILLHYL
jgi:hypothetical protein